MFSRRPIASHNRGRAAQQYQSGAPLPIELGGLLLWADANYTTDTGNGTSITALTDRSPNAANMVATGASGGPVRRDGGGRMPRYMQFSSGRVLETTNAALLALSAGTAKDKTIIFVWEESMTNANGTSYMYSWGDGANINNFVTGRTTVSVWDESCLVRDSSFNNTITSPTPTSLHGAIQISVHRYSGGQLQFRTDGVNKAAASVNQGTRTVTSFGIGVHLNGASRSELSHHRLFHMLVYNRALSDAECQQVETYFSATMGPLGLGWKSGYAASAAFGPGAGNWLVVALLGQSNMVGADPDLYAGDGTTQGLYVLYQDGTLASCSEPTWDAANAPWVQSAGGTSLARRLGELLRAGGETRNILFVPCAMNGSSVAFWTSSLTQEPPQITFQRPVTFTKHWIDEAMKAPNSELLIVVYQGENEANAGQDPATWSPAWASIQDNLNTRYAGRFAKTKPWFFIQLPATSATGYTNWATIRTNQATHCSVTRADATLVQYSGETHTTDPTLLHVDKATQVNQIAPAVAAAILAGV